MKGRCMQKRGSGRFGKYGDLKRKEKIRQTRVLKHDGVTGRKTQGPVFPGPSKARFFKPAVDVERGILERTGCAERYKREDDER